MKRIKKVEKGDTSRTLLHAEMANAVIDACNAFLGLEFIPSGSAKLEVSGGSAKITFNSGNIGVKGFMEADDGSLVLGTFKGFGTFEAD